MHRKTISPPERGYSLMELMIVLVVLTVGVLAVAKLFPSATREQTHDRLRTACSYHAQEKLETLRTLNFSDPDIQEGRHPVGSNESVGPTGAWERYYTVSEVPSPLDNLRLVTVVVRWQTPEGSDSVVASTYVDR